MPKPLMLLGALVAASLLPLTSPPLAPESTAASARPNVVLIVTDDMRADDLTYMRYTRRLFRDTGTVFTNAISPHPLCCPARAELITGQYAQNNGVRHNRSHFGGGGWQALREKDRTIFQWFHQEGYRTGYVGKFIHGYKGGDITGLTDNDVAVGNIYNQRNLRTWNNGDVVTHRGHQTWTVRDRTNRMIRSSDEPFFMWTGYLAPHSMKRPRTGWGPPIPPKRYDEARRRGDFRLQAKVGERDVSDKPLVNRSEKRPRRRAMKEYHRDRVLSLYAVDDAVRSTVKALKRAGEYDDTILVFASDNGFLLGEHNLKGKNQPYQASLRVPLMMRGPGVPRQRIDAVTTLVDLPGTVARLAGIEPGLPQDGEDLFSAPADRAVLIQAGDGDAAWRWRGVYTRRHTFVRYPDGSLEFYDRAADPHELESRPDDHLAMRLGRLLDTLGPCAGSSCAATFKD